MRTTILLALAATIAWGQSFTGTLSGTVQDSSGAVVPAAQIVLTNANTNERRAQQSNQDGSYLFALLPPGSYRLEADSAGFKKMIRPNVVVEVNQSLRIDIALEVGSATESVQVTAETPLLQPNTSALGQVVDNRKIVEFPLAGRNTFALISLTAGAQPLGEFGNLPARANAYASGYFSMNGSQPLSNETLIDGVPANAATTNAPGFTPSVDAIQEFKVQSGNFTAEFGRTGGGVINLVFKSGSNELHGTMYEFLRNSALDANNFFNNRAGRRKARNVLNQFGATAGGPLIKDRTFWFVSYEGLRDRRALSQTYTIPTTQQLQGDFTGTLNAAGQLITIADPATTRANPAAAGTFLRDLFPGNRIPADRIDTVAARIRSFWPAPNSAGTGPARVNNWTGAGVAPNVQDQFSTRLDHSFNDRHKLFGRFSWSNINRGGFDFFGNGAGWVNPGGSGMPIDVNARNLSLDDTYTFTPTLLLNVRYGFVRQWVARDPPLNGLDLTTLGFPASYNAQVGARALPSFMPTGFRAVQQRGTDNIRRGDLTHSMQGNITKVTSRHNIKTGADYRVILLNEFEPVISQGQFFFDGRFTSADPLRIPANSGHSIASLMLGLPNSGNIDIQPPISVNYRYFGGYVQDDFKVNQKLTFNLGIRYEIETGRGERYNRLSYFDEFAVNPLGPRVGIPDLRGGLRFVGVDGNGVRQKRTNQNNWGPRFGFAYQIDARTVVRGGYGLFFLPNTGDGAGPANANEGFTAVTQFVSSLDGGITPLNRLSNPFPNGVLRGPGSSQGLLTQLGQNLTTVRYADRPAYAQAWNFNIQRELPRNFLFDIAWAANKGTSLPINLEINQIADQYLALGAQLLTQVPNPFREFVAVGGLSQPTVARGQLLRPFPQYTGVLQRDVRTGSSIYHSLQLKLEHRFSHGFSFLGAFTAAKQIGTPLAHAVVADPGFQNNNQRYLDRSLAGFDVARRVVLSGTWELPVGKGKSLLGSARGPLQVIAGGWQINGVVTLQGGFPLGAGTASNQTNSFGGGSRPNNNGTSARLPSGQRTLDRWFDTAVFSQPAPFTFGNTSRTLPDVRTPGLTNFDFSLTKNTRINDRLNTQFRVEFFNGFNHANFGSPGNALGNANFGVISAALDPRIIQLGLKILF